MTKKMTEGSPARLIVLFTIPLLIGNIFQQFYNLADTLIVGRTIGVNALAAVGCTGSIIFFVLGFVQGFTAGLAILAAQCFGAKDEAGLRKSFATSICISIAVSIILTILSLLFVRQMLEIMQTPPEIIDDAYAFLIVILGGTFANVLFNLLSNIIRALGDSKTPLYFLVIACLINIALDYILILVFHMGVAGAAWATITAQGISGILCIIYIKKKLPIIHLTRDDFRITSRDLKQHLRIASPMGFQMSIIAIGALILQFVLNGLGSVSVAAYTTAQKIDQIAAQPMNSFGITMATYTAQNYGAGKIERIKKGLLQCSLISVTFAVIMGLFNIFAGYHLSGLFVGPSETQVLSLSQTYLQINGALYFVLAMLFILRFTLQGLGRSLTPTIAGIMELVMRTFAAIVLAAHFGFAGACWASPLAWIGACIPLVVDYILTMKKLSRPKMQFSDQNV